jgi:hypothetical protein
MTEANHAKESESLAQSDRNRDDSESPTVWLMSGLPAPRPKSAGVWSAEGELGLGLVFDGLAGPHGLRIIRVAIFGLPGYIRIGPEQPGLPDSKMSCTEPVPVSSAPPAVLPGSGVCTTGRSGPLSDRSSEGDAGS